MYYIGIDLGGTNIKVGVCDENYKIIGRGDRRTNLPRSAEAIAADMVAAVKDAVAAAGISMKDVAWVGIGAPGSIDPVNGVIRYANNLYFDNVPIVRYVQEGLGIKTFIENDANAAAYGEALDGAAKGVSVAVALTLGTGVGGGVIIDGKIFTGFNYAGAELGHMVVEKGGWPCTCGRLGCFEAYSSATGLIKMTRLGMEAHRDSAMWKIAGSLEKAGGRTACDGVRAGDAAAIEVFNKYVDYLACGIVSIINIFQPEILCLGGGVSKEGDFLLKPLNEKVDAEQYTRGDVPKTKLMIAKLGNDAGIVGAAFLGRQH